MVATTDCRELVSSFLAGNSQTAPTHMAFGTGTSVPNAEDTALNTENTRNAMTSTTLTGQEVSFKAILNATQANGVVITEIGLLNASSSGTLFTRNTFSSITKANTFQIEATIILRVE